MANEPPRIQFLTGRLAENALRAVVHDLATTSRFIAEIQVLPISVASLAPTWWIARHLTVGDDVSRIVIPGMCQGDLAPIEARAAGAKIERGPDDLLDLPRFFGQDRDRREGYGPQDLEIIAEINHAPSLSTDVLIDVARQFRDQGADIIDLGCDPGGPWPGVRDAVKALRDQGLRVSIDSFDRTEVGQAIAAGAELVLSVNASNVEFAADWGVEVVVIPDSAGSLEGLESTSEILRDYGVPHRLDPIVEPIGLGFAASLGRYLKVRERWPDAEIMMGVGNVTELVDADSCAINVLLAGFCQELRIRSALTTAVAHWAKSSIRELDLARRLMRHAQTKHILPKHIEPALHILRDAVPPKQRGRHALLEMQGMLRDRNWRLFVEGDRLVAINADGLHDETDPFTLFERMAVDDPAHAFYLGFELAKAKIAQTLGKNYHQDRALDWGLLSIDETPRHLDFGRGAGGDPP
jgi:dihydropteroate synthase